MDPKVKEYTEHQKRRLSMLLELREKTYEDFDLNIFASDESSTPDEPYNYYSMRIRTLEKILNQIKCTNFLLENKHGEVISIVVTNGEPDPSRLFISNISPLGQILLESHIGNRVAFRGEEYTIILIQ